MQEPSASAPHAFVADADYVSGDCRIVLSGESKRDFTGTPNSILRGKRIPLAVTVFLRGCTSYQHPSFSLNPGWCTGVLHGADQAFVSIWRQLKLAGLLKRIVTRPARSGFEYQYNCSTSHISSTVPRTIMRTARYPASARSATTSAGQCKIKRLFGANGSQPAA